MRSRQALETHLNRQTDLAGTRERISTRGSSGRAATATAPSFLEQSMPLRVICGVGVEMEMSVNARERERERERESSGNREEKGALPAAGDGQDRRRRRGAVRGKPKSSELGKVLNPRRTTLVLCGGRGNL